MAVLNPMPIASDATATRVKPGLLRSHRSAYRTSERIVSSTGISRITGRLKRLKRSGGARKSSPSSVGVRLPPSRKRFGGQESRTLHQRKPGRGRGGLLVGAPRAAQHFAKTVERPRNVARRPPQAFRASRRQLFLDDDLAAHAARCQRILEHGAEQPSLVGVSANVRIADFLWLDEAADNQPGARRARVLEQRGDRLRGAALHDLHAPRDLARVLFSAIEPVVVWLTRFGDGRIAHLDHASRHRARRGCGPFERDRDGETRLDPKADGNHFISSITSSNDIASSVKVS